MERHFRPAAGGASQGPKRRRCRGEAGSPGARPRGSRAAGVPGGVCPAASVEGGVAAGAASAAGVRLRAFRPGGGGLPHGGRAPAVPGAARPLRLTGAAAEPGPTSGFPQCCAKAEGVLGCSAVVRLHEVLSFSYACGREARYFTQVAGCSDIWISLDTTCLVGAALG